jgi:hypothetical protein
MDPMRFPTTTVVPALALVAALGAGGCSADDEPSPATAPTLSDSAGRPVPTEPAGTEPTIHGRYSVRLALLDWGAAEDRTYRLELTNTGRSADRYVVTLGPALAGSADPAQLELDSGRSADVTIRLSSELPPGTKAVEVRVHSSGARDDLASFELPDSGA